MKRKLLIEWGIIAIGLVCGYRFFDSIVNLIFRVFAFGSKSRISIDTTLPIIIMTFIYLICFILLLRNSHRLAIYFDRRRGDETVPFKIGKTALLHVILIGICLTVIISNADDILVYFFEIFRQEVGDVDEIARVAAADKTYAFKMAISQVIFASAVMIFSRNICQWFIREDEHDVLVFDSETKK